MYYGEVGKTTAIYVNFLRDVAWGKLLKSANVSQSYSKNNIGTVFLRHGVDKKYVSYDCNFYILLVLVW